MLGLGITVRFAVGAETGPVKIGPIVLGLVTMAVGSGLGWRARATSRSVDAPPSVRPLLVRTPLARPQ